MFNAVSMTGVGAVITVLETIAKMIGIELPEGSVASAVNGVVAVVGLVLLIVGQYRRKDLVAGIVRR